MVTDNVHWVYFYKNPSDDPELRISDKLNKEIILFYSYKLLYLWLNLFHISIIYIKHLIFLICVILISKQISQYV